MSLSDEPSPTPGGPAPSGRDANVSALLWLGRWIGIPFLILVGLFYAEPLFRGAPAPEFVPSSTTQQVSPYPHDGAQAPSLAPPDLPRLKPLPYPAFPDVLPPPNTPSEIVASPISQPKPVYPQRALEREKEGTVRVRITIAADGNVSDVVVVIASPPGWFESAALEAVRKWKYHPPGRPLVTEAVIEFKLD